VSAPYRDRRSSVDLAAYPDLIVVYLGMRAETLRGVGTLLRTGPEIDRAVAEAPDGLLLHEPLIWGLWPLHLGMRQYWRDFEALETWARTGTHMGWWRAFARDGGGVSIWHETYALRGGMEAIYGEGIKVGAARFAPPAPARGSMFTARSRMRRAGDERVAAPVAEEEYEPVRR
jgi:hypothetical protein